MLKFKRGEIPAGRRRQRRRGWAERAAAALTAQAGRPQVCALPGRRRGWRSLLWTWMAAESWFAGSLALGPGEAPPSEELGPGPQPYGDPSWSPAGRPEGSTELEPQRAQSMMEAPTSTSSREPLAAELGAAPARLPLDSMFSPITDQLRYHRLRGAVARAGHRPAGADSHGPGRPRPAPQLCWARGLGSPGILSPRRRRQLEPDNPKLQAGRSAVCTEYAQARATEHQVRADFSRRGNAAHAQMRMSQRGK